MREALSPSCSFVTETGVFLLFISDAFTVTLEARVISRRLVAASAVYLQEGLLEATPALVIHLLQLDLGS